MNDSCWIYLIQSLCYTAAAVIAPEIVSTVGFGICALGSWYCFYVVLKEYRAYCERNAEDETCEEQQD